MVQEDETMVNLGDEKYFSHLYRVSLNNYDPFSYLVYANHEQHALDQVANYLNEQKNTGYFVDAEDYANDEVMIVGCQGHWVVIEHMHIELQKRTS